MRRSQACSMAGVTDIRLGSDFTSETDEDETFSQATDQTMSSNKLMNTAKRLNAMIKGDNDFDFDDINRAESGLQREESSQDEDAQDMNQPEITVEELGEPEVYDLVEAKRRQRQHNFVESYRKKELSYALQDAEQHLKEAEAKGYISPARKKVIRDEKLELKKREKRVRDVSPVVKKDMASLSNKANNIMAELKKKWYGYEGIQEEDEDDKMPDVD